MGEAAKFKLIASGNGYLWIYELGPDNSYTLLYPSVTTASNQISAGKSFIIPDSNDYGITAGDQAGEEQLLFVITSTDRPALANKIAARFAGSTTKAYGGQVTENWGVYELKYPVGL